MKLTSFTYFILLMVVPVLCKAQVDTTATDSTFLQVPIFHTDSSFAVPLDSLILSRADSVHRPAADSLKSNPTDTLESAKPEINFKVRRWYYHAPLLSKTAATDSTLRWHVWLDWLSKKNRVPGVITYQLGTIARMNTMQINAQTPRYQKLYWENVPMNNPVTGMANWSYMPILKLKRVYENNLGTVHRTTFNLKEYYLTRPLTKLKYTQSSFDTRGLSFMASYNFGRKTNVELSYWNRRGGGKYPDSKIRGNQIYGRITHILGHHQEVKLNFMRTKYHNGKPFGYKISNPFTYNFNKYTTSAVYPSGHIKRSSSILSLHYYQRPDTTEPASLHATLYMRNLNRKLTFSNDTISYKVRDMGVAIRKWYEIGPLKLEGSTSFDYFALGNRQHSPLELDSWSLFSVSGKAVFTPIPFLQISGSGNLRIRNDGFSDNRLGLGIDIKLPLSLNINVGFTTGSRMPTPQQLYWQTTRYHGNSGLRKEKISAIHGKLTIHPFKGTEVGVAAYLKQIKHGVFVGKDSMFVNSNPYGTFSADAFINYSSKHLELSGSVTLQQYGHFLTTGTKPLPVSNGQRIWFRAGAYVKGYLFNHATYIKAGVSGLMSPQRYKPDTYYPSLNVWEPGGSSLIPSFSRLDIDISAKLRWIMFVLRYENVLDGFTQPGYFETPGFPMPGRRFIFGIRVYFRN